MTLCNERCRLSIDVNQREKFATVYIVLRDLSFLPVFHQCSNHDRDSLDDVTRDLFARQSKMFVYTASCCALDWQEVSFWKVDFLKFE